MVEFLSVTVERNLVKKETYLKFKKSLNLQAAKVAMDLQDF